MNHLANSITDETRTHLTRLATEEGSLGAQAAQNDTPVQIPKTELEKYRSEVVALQSKLNNFGKHVAIYWSKTKDENKIRQFFQLVSFQFLDYIM